MWLLIPKFTHSFVCYRTKMDPREIIEKHMADLLVSIDVKNTRLWDQLIQLGVFKSGDVEHIKVRF